MRYSRFSTILALSATANEAYAFPALWKRSDNPEGHPICIVGAGPAGLKAAHTLQEQGLKAVVFEKQDTVGGKCQSYYDEKGQYHPLGALLYSTDSYPETMKIVRQTKVKSEDIMPKREEGHRWQYDYRTGEVMKSMTMNVFTDGALNFDVWRYKSIWEKEFSKYAGVGFKNGIPDSLTIPTKQWLDEHHFVALHFAFMAGMVLYGYGAYEHIPVAYMLQYFTPDIMDFFASGHPGGLIDYHAVWVEFSKRFIQQPIHLDARISRIDRPSGLIGGSGNPVVTYKVGENGESQVQECASLVLAFPPTVKNLEAANLQVSRAERKLFSEVITENYYSGAVRVKFPEDYTFTHVSDEWYSSPPADGEVALAIKLWADNDVATIYSWDDLYKPRMKSFAQAKEMTRKSMSIINKPNPADKTSKAIPVKNEDILAFRTWDYFPRAMGDSLKNKFYEKFGQIQGQQRTYYASGLNGFETVEFAIRAGEDVVKSYFVPWLKKNYPNALASASAEASAQPASSNRLSASSQSKSNKKSSKSKTSSSDSETEFLSFSDSESSE